MKARNIRIPSILLPLWILAAGRTAAAQSVTEPAVVPTDSALRLGGGRFQINLDWQSPTASGSGHAVALTSDTGYFWFFDPTNVEVVVKVLDACAASQREWVFAAGLTDVGISMTVTDTETQFSKTYVNPSGTAFLPIQDTDAFGCSPEPATTEWIGTFDSAEALDCTPNVPASATLQQQGSAVEGLLTADPRGCGAVRARFTGAVQGRVVYGTVVGGVDEYRFKPGSTAHGTLSGDTLELVLQQNGPSSFPIPGGTLHLHRK